MRRAALLLSLLAIALPAAALAGPGTESTSTLPLPTEAAELEAGVVGLTAARGSVFAALGGQGSYGYLGVVRLSRSGRPDTDFGEGGFTPGLEVPFENFVEIEPEATALAIQRDGKVVVAGYVREELRRPASVGPLVVRYGADGHLDRSFSEDGILGSAPQTQSGALYHDVAIAPDRDILLAGGRDEEGGGFFGPTGLVVALKPDGRPDKAFGDRGQVVFKGKDRASFSSLRGIESLPNGKILVAGYLDGELFLAKLDADGSLDQSFGGGDGKVTLDLREASCCEDAALALAGRGRIVVAAVGGGYPKDHVFLARYLPSGRLDRTFGDGGVEARLRPRRLGALLDLAVQRDGKIVTAGRTEIARADGKRAFALFRNLPDGRPDRTFGREGLLAVRRGSESIAGAALAIPGGVLAAGSFLEAKKGEADPKTGLLLARPR